MLRVRDLFPIKKRKPKPAGIVIIDPSLIEEPKENPHDLPLILACGEEIWRRREIRCVGGVVATAHYHNEKYWWVIGVHLPGIVSKDEEGFWVLGESDPRAFGSV